MTIQFFTFSMRKGKAYFGDTSLSMKKHQTFPCLGRDLAEKGQVSINPKSILFASANS